VAVEAARVEAAVAAASTEVTSPGVPDPACGREKAASFLRLSPSDNKTPPIFPTESAVSFFRNFGLPGASRLRRGTGLSAALAAQRYTDEGRHRWASH